MLINNSIRFLATLVICVSSSAFASGKAKTDFQFAKKNLTTDLAIEAHWIKGKSAAQLLLRNKSGKVLDQVSFGPSRDVDAILKSQPDISSNYFKVYKSFDSQIPFFEVSTDTGDSSEVSSTLTQVFHVYKNKITADASFESIGQGEGGVLREFNADLLPSKKELRLLVGINKNQKEHLPKLPVVSTEPSASEEPNLMVTERYWKWNGTSLNQTVNFEYEHLPYEE